MTATLGAIGAVAAVVGAGPAGLSGGSGTVSGTFGAVSSLRGPVSQRIVTLRAIRASDAVVVVAHRLTSSSGQYSLRLPADVYLLVANAASFQGGTVKTAVSPLVQVKTGKRRVVPLGAAAKHTRSRTSSARATASDYAGAPKRLGVNQAMPVSGSEIPPRGLGDMVTTVLANFPCPNGGKLEVDATGDDLKKLYGELKFQQSPYVDPSTRVTPHLHHPNYTVEGGGTVSGGTLTLQLRLVKIKTGRVTASASVSGPYSGESFSELAEQLARQLALEACKPELPESYTGTVSGSYHASSAAQDTTEKWTATGVVFERNARGDYDLKAGTASWSLSGTYAVECTISASATLPLAPGGDRHGQILFGADGTYVAEAGGSWTVMATVTCPEVTYDLPYYPFPSGAWLQTNGEGLSPAADGTLKGSYTQSPGSGEAESWEWNLTPVQ